MLRTLTPNSQAVSNTIAVSTPASASAPTPTQTQTQTQTQTVAWVRSKASLGSMRSLVVLALLGTAALLSVATSSQPPVIEQVTPGMGDSSVALDQPLEVLFERPVDPDTATLSSVVLRRISDNAMLPATLERHEGNHRLILRPESPLDPQTDYAMELDLDVLRSEDGAPYVGLRYNPGSENVWETSGVLHIPFTTRRELTVARAFVQEDPCEIWVYFSEPVDPASLALHTVRLELGGIEVPLDLRYSEAEGRLRLIPLAPLAPEATYLVHLSGSIATPAGALLGEGEGDVLRLDPTDRRIR